MCKLEGGWILADMKRFFFFFAQDVCLKANTLTWIFFKKSNAPDMSKQSEFFLQKFTLTSESVTRTKKRDKLSVNKMSQATLLHISNTVWTFLDLSFRPKGGKNALSDKKNSEYNEHKVWAERWSPWAITAYFPQSGQFLEYLLQKIVLHLSFSGAYKYMTKAEQKPHQSRILLTSLLNW